MKRITQKGGIKILLIVAVLTVLTMGTGTLLAYLADTDNALNHLSIYNDDLTIEEEFDPPDKIEQGSYAKRVAIKNSGASSCYVRVKVVFSDSSFDSITSLDLNTDTWSELQDDGYYYYLKALAVGEESEPLFTNITFSETPTITDEGFDVIIIAESADTSSAADSSYRNFDDPISAFNGLEEGDV